MASDDYIAGWPVTEGTPGGGRYSPLDDITTTNVDQLERVWTYRHGDFFEGTFPINRGTSFVTTPILVGDQLILTTPTNRVISLDPETGREHWTFDPELDRDEGYANMWANRGVASWHGRDKESCSPRVFLTTLDARLVALDVQSGRRCEGFPDVDLRASLPPMPDPREYGSTSPATVLGDVVVVGSSIPDQIRPNSPSGDVRGFDARSGKLLWTFHTIPRPGEHGSDTWEGDIAMSGAANVWAPMTADPERNLVFLPVSSASPDHYGGDRRGANLFSDSVVALDAATGIRRWHFQAVHHDLWDYDLAAPPLLIELEHQNRQVPAVVLLTKTGHVFALHRETGEPIFPVEERPVPRSDVPGEQAWPTQPLPQKPPPLVPQSLSEAELYAPTPEHRNACAKRLAQLRNDGVFTPPSLRGTLVYPATGGGANWPGGAFDPVRRLLFVPVNNIAQVIYLEHVSDANIGEDAGAHPMQGLSWRNIWWHFTGRGTGQRYRLDGGHILFAHEGVPCNRPPWGRLVAVDMDKAEIAWSASTSTGPDDVGNSTYQPPLATAGGLVFHGGSWWPVLRIHDASTGELLRTIDLPAGAHGGTITYKLRKESRQFLVVTAGGHDQMGSPKGDFVIGYALPE